MTRRVSARRALAVVAALLALPWPVWALGYAFGDGGVVWGAICVATIAIIVAAPLLVEWRQFGCLAGVLWFGLIVFGFVTAIAFGFVMWPAAFVFAIAAIPRRETTWPLGRVLAVACVLAAAVAASVFAIAA